MMSSISRTAHRLFDHQHAINPLLAADPVSFDVAVRGRAGIPEWLTLVDATNSSYLYGTPRNEDVGTLVLEVGYWGFMLQCITNKLLVNLFIA